MWYTGKYRTPDCVKSPWSWHSLRSPHGFVESALPKDFRRCAAIISVATMSASGGIIGYILEFCDLLWISIELMLLPPPIIICIIIIIVIIKKKEKWRLRTQAQKYSSLTPPLAHRLWENYLVTLALVSESVK